MKPEEIDIIAPWINSIHINKGVYKAKVFNGRILEARSFKNLVYMISVTIARDTVELVADLFGLDPEKIGTPISKRFQYTDARIIITYILRHRYAFSYPLIKNVLRYKSNQSIRRVPDVIENSFEIQKKLARVYSHYPFLKDKISEL